jgi:tetratricopeptide (TPR) repeat protein
MEKHNMNKTRKQYLWNFVTKGAILAAAALVFLGCRSRPETIEPEPNPPGIFSTVLSSEAEDLVRLGISYHDRGDYETAIDYYKKALDLAPDHPLILYELAFSYLYQGDSETAIDVAEKGIATAEERGMQDVIPNLFDIKGSALDNLDRSAEAIDVYLTAINQYGASNTFLYYNLGLSYYRIEKHPEAREALLQGLLLNPNHPSSNLLLARISAEEGQKTQAFYAFCYFLLLEPNTARAVQAYNTLLNMLSKQEQIGLMDNGTFTASDMVISLSFVLDDENAGKSEAEKTKAKLYYLLTSLEELKNAGKIERGAGDELYWDFYAPFFNRIAVSGYFGTFCRYIALTSDPEADDWIINGREEIDGFFEWLNEAPKE